MKYVTKLGAYGLAVAAAFAVALAVLVSVSSTPTAEAAAVPLPAADRAVTVAPGDTVNIVVADAFAQLTITDTADGVGASFAANDGQSLSCSDDASCDTDDNDPTAAGRQNVVGSVTVVLNVDADSGTGHILLSVSGIGSNNTDLTKVITVSKAGLVGSLEIKADAATDKTIAAAAGTSNLTVTVKNASTPAGGLLGQSVSVITTHGTVGCGTGAGTASAGATQTCSATSDAAGVVDVVLTGGGVEGQAVVTARLTTLTATATVTMFGSAKNLSAEPMQDSVEIGGSVYVVLTVTDGAGNPVSGQTVTAVSSKEVVGPADDAVLVETEQATPATSTSEIGVGYSSDFIGAKAADNIPACGDDNTGSLNSPSTEVFTTDGTNDAGKCVVKVTAPDGGTATTTATRGAHTLNFALNSLKDSVTIEVAGKPASISTDAPPRVDPGSVTTITVSVFDDEDVLVGITSVKVRKVDGGGLIEDESAPTTPGSEMTSNGQSKFTFIAPSADGSSEILISAGDVDHRVTLNIGLPDEECPDGSSVPAGEDCAEVVCESGPNVANGETCPDVECSDGSSVADGEECPRMDCPDGTSVADGETCPEPEPVAPEAGTLTIQGNLGSYSGGSLDDFAAAADAACPGGSQIAAQDADGAWQLWSSTAPAFVNIGFNTAFADGFDGATLVWVTSCEADAMDSETGMEEGSMTEGSTENGG